MATFEHGDDGVVVIIGSGAGGGTLAHELTRSGIKVVLLEAGKRESIATFSQDPGVAFGQLTWLDPRTQSGTWGVPRDFPTLPAWIAKTVGGTTVHWTAATPRNRDWEVTARTSYGDIPGTSLIDWPIKYEELKNYYQLAERRLGVTRRNGVPGMPASNNFKVLYAGAKKLGYKRVHTNYMAINPRPWDGRAFCIQQGFCAQGCKTGAKWSTLYTEIPRAEATGNLDLRIQCMATRIEHGADGRVTGVVYKDAKGQEQRQKARVVCVAGNALETPRLLLLVGVREIPARSCEFVRPGRAQLHAPCHQLRVGRVRQAGVCVARCDARRHRRGRDDQRSEARLRRRLSPRTMRARPAHDAARRHSLRLGPRFRFNHRQLPQHRRHIGEWRRYAARRQSHHARCKGQATPMVLPVAHVHVDEHPNDLALRAHATGQAAKLYESIGAKRVVKGNHPPATHNMGTARMSAKPGDGVTNAWGQTHDIKNLFVSDGSLLSTPGSANPTLTIVALVLRQSEYIRREMSARNI